MNSETWLQIAGYEGVYEVSDLGRVRRIKKAQSTSIGKVLKPSINSVGYMLVGLSNGGACKSHKVHRLVAAAFLRPSGLFEVNHKNGDKTDNRLANLELSSRSENMKHAVRVLGVVTPRPYSSKWPRDKHGRFVKDAI